MLFHISVIIDCMNNTKVLIGIIVALVLIFIVYIIIDQKRHLHDKAVARGVETALRHKLYMVEQEIQNRNDEQKRYQDSLLTAGLVAAESRRVDSLSQLQNERDSIEHVTFAVDRIRQFGQKYMKEISPNSGENLEVQVDPALLQFDPLTRVFILPFEVKWDAYMYGVFKTEHSKSKHEFSGAYRLMNNYDEYIETIYKNYALEEGIKSNRKFQNTVRDLDNIAEILDKVNKIDQALNNR